MKKSVLFLSLMLGLASVTHAQLVNGQGQNINPFTGKPLELGHTPIPDNIHQVVPNEVDFNKLNEKRDCSPAELLAGKTNCGRCDPDTPNVVKAYHPNLATEMAKNGGVFIYGQEEFNKYTGKLGVINNVAGSYLNAFDFIKYTGTKPQGIKTTPERRQVCKQDGNCEILTPYILYRGYNLKGISKDFDPFNNRAVCEFTRPQNNEDASKGKQGFNGAAILGLAGATIGVNMLNQMNMTNANGAQGAMNQAGKALGSLGGSVNPMIVPQIFACLEYYTGTNPSYCGGDHLRMNTDGKAHYCKTPMQIFYNTKVPEIQCKYGPCDGKQDGAFMPTTIPMRKMLLMTNPYYMIGQTAPQSLRIATQRPMSCTAM